MVFGLQNCSNIQLEKIVLVIEKKLMKFEAERREFAKKNQIIRTIPSNSERSDQFLKQNAF